MAGSTLLAYQTLLETGELRPDMAQANAIKALQALETALAARVAAGDEAKPTGLFARLRQRAPKAPPLRGLYMWGGVGRGKSMLMDLFFDHAPITKKRRVHFHEFMVEVHDAIHAHRNSSQGGDPIDPVARVIARKARLLCFDEMQVKDVATAGILGRLFKVLLSEGVVVVTTSNRPPRDLYKDGINREIIFGFHDLLAAQFDIIELNGPTDYRRDRLKGLKTYYTPNGPQATDALRRVFFKSTDRDVDNPGEVPTATLRVKGRDVFVPKSLKGVAVFSFKRLCAAMQGQSPLGAEDYLAIARAYHTVLIVGVPKLGPHNRNEAMRFITLIDALYENRVKLFMAADAPPEALYEAGDGRFEFDRTVSRLNEMQSEGYLEQGHARQAA